MTQYLERAIEMNDATTIHEGDSCNTSSFQASSHLHREQGLTAHKAFLEQDMLLFEDVSLKSLKFDDNLEKVIALPLRFARGDGAPCSVIGFIG